MISAVYLISQVRDKRPFEKLGKRKQDPQGDGTLEPTPGRRRFARLTR